MAHQKKKHYQKHDHALQKREAWAAYADAIREDAASVDLDALIEVYRKSDAFKSNNERYRKQLTDTWKCRKRKLEARAVEVDEDDAA